MGLNLIMYKGNVSNQNMTTMCVWVTSLSTLSNSGRGQSSVAESINSCMGRKIFQSFHDDFAQTHCRPNSWKKWANYTLRKYFSIIFKSQHTFLESKIGDPSCDFKICNRQIPYESATFLNHSKFGLSMNNESILVISFLYTNSLWVK
jgi:hypothetical protein